MIEALAIAEQSMKTDFYIKLNSEADMPTALSYFYHQDYLTVVDEETGEETQTPEGDPYLVTTGTDYAIDVVGVIYEPTGNILTDADGNEYPEKTQVPGWHINIRILGDVHRSEVEAIDATYGVVPSSPSRIFI